MNVSFSGRLFSPIIATERIEYKRFARKKVTDLTAFKLP